MKPKYEVETVGDEENAYLSFMVELTRLETYLKIIRKRQAIALEKVIQAKKADLLSEDEVRAYEETQEAEIVRVQEQVGLRLLKAYAQVHHF